MNLREKSLLLELIKRVESLTTTYDHNTKTFNAEALYTSVWDEVEIGFDWSTENGRETLREILELLEKDINTKPDQSVIDTWR